MNEFLVSYTKELKEYMSRSKGKEKNVRLIIRTEKVEQGMVISSQT